VEFEVHGKFSGQRAKVLGDLIGVDLESSEMKFEAGQKDAGFNVGILVRLQNIAAILENERGDSRDQAFLVGTGN
jgi:hypothetical protein